METRNHLKAWIYLAPALLVLLVFTLYPIINTLIMAFQNGYDMLAVRGGATYQFGVSNFVTVLDFSKPQGKLFLRALQNTAIIVFITVPLSTIIALLIAVALNSIKPFQKILQTIYFLPYITNTLAIAAVFAIIFQSAGAGAGATAGLLNNILAFFGQKPVDWLGGTNYWASIGVVIIYDVWAGLPFKILVLTGALQSVNKQCYEAAKIDGTPRRRVLTKITVPLISPMIFYLFVTGFIGAFKEYTSVVGLFSAPGSESMGFDNYMITIVGFIYRYIDGDKYAGQYGVASAAALILLVIIMFFTAINFFVGKKRVHY